jgi:hypothetical protein
MTYTIEMEYEQVDAIFVQELKEQYSSMKKSLEQRQSGEEKIGIFSTDIDADIVEIQSHIDALAKVLSYNMLEEEFEAVVGRIPGWNPGDSKETNNGI